MEAGSAFITDDEDDDMVERKRMYCNAVLVSSTQHQSAPEQGLDFSFFFLT